MPLPILFIGVIAASSLAGGQKAVHAAGTAKEAHDINVSANDLVNASYEHALAEKNACGQSLTDLGDLKLDVLTNSVNTFIDTFQQIKNINFNESEELDELKKMHNDQKDFEELQEMEGVAINLMKSVSAGASGGAATGLAAWGLANVIGSASTGTAISSLAGAAAHNATLAWLGGGALSAGGMGIAGGTMILGGLVAGPALLVLGNVADNRFKKDLETAKMNMDAARVEAEQYNTASDQCCAIRRRTYMFYKLLAQLDVRFEPQVEELQNVLKAEGTDFRTYSPEAKETVKVSMATVKTIKTLLDTPILTGEGYLTEESESVIKQITMA